MLNNYHYTWFIQFYEPAKTPRADYIPYMKLLNDHFAAEESDSRVAMFSCTSYPEQCNRFELEDQNSLIILHDHEHYLAPGLTDLDSTLAFIKDIQINPEVRNLYRITVEPSIYQTMKDMRGAKDRLVNETWVSNLAVSNGILEYFLAHFKQFRRNTSP